MQFRRNWPEHLDE
jgi:hypothetical protein